MNKQVALGFFAVLALADKAAAAVTDQKTWSQSFPVSAAMPRLLIDNIWGNVRVRIGTAREIAVIVDEKRSAPSQELFELSKQTIFLDVKADGDGVAMVVGKQDDTVRPRINRCRGCRVDYQFEVTVPPGTQIDVSTVTDGSIDVAGGGGPVSASNVNGPVEVKDLQDCAQIESVNGAVEVAFARAPSRDCSIKTINGDITLTVPGGTGLDAALSVMQGSVVSEFDLEPLALPAKIDQRKEEGRFVYHIEQAAGIRLGTGGPTFSIESLNGDLRIRRSK
ncbi:MAG TPA: hypothetical protein VN705_02255 [Steroidobacteraceae bacterium]|jgi:hypothetical protein|nr:hypothetical protein [Steroidobacteraceae bacterium]